MREKRKYITELIENDEFVGEEILLDNKDLRMVLCKFNPEFMVKCMLVINNLENLWRRILIISRWKLGRMQEDIGKCREIEIEWWTNLNIDGCDARDII